MQTAGISFRAFYKLGTEPLPLGLEKLIVGNEKSHRSERHGRSLLQAANQRAPVAP